VIKFKHKSLARSTNAVYEYIGEYIWIYMWNVECVT